MNKTKVEVNLGDLRSYIDSVGDEYDGEYVEVDVNYIQEDQTWNHPGYEDIEILDVEGTPKELY